MKDGPLKTVLDQFHGFIPRAHEEAMEVVRNMRRSANDYVADHRNNEELVAAYNNAIAGLTTWRRMHYHKMVEKFVIGPMQIAMGGATKEEAWDEMVGTGGSAGNGYLLDHIRTTEDTAFRPCPIGRRMKLAGMDEPMCGGFLQCVDPDRIVYDPKHRPSFSPHVYANAGHWEFTHNRGQALSEAEVRLIPRGTTPQVVPQDSEFVWVPEDTQAVNTADQDSCGRRSTPKINTEDTQAVKTLVAEDYRYYILALLVAILAAALTVNATMQ